MQLRLFAILATVFLTPIAPLARAQPLADRLPADTMIYLGWQGAGSPAPGFEGSRLQAVLKGSDLPQFVNEFLPAAAQLLAQKDADVARVLPLVQAVAQPLWNYPSALYVGPMNVNPGGGGPPMPRVAVLIQAGADADRVLADLNSPLTQAKNAGAPLAAKAGNGLVVVALGPNLADELLAPRNANAPALAADAAFKSAMAQVPHDPVVAAYVNVRQIVTMADVFTLAAPPEALATWTKARDAIGLRGVQSLAMGAAFDGKDWATGVFVAAPSPRSGFLKMVEGKPLDDAFLKFIPRTSQSMFAGRFRPGMLLDAARAAWPLFGDNLPPLDSLLQQANAIAGFDIEKDLFAAFGDEWALYTDPMIGGNGLVGTVLVHRAADPAKLEQSLGKLEQLANGLLAANMGAEGITYHLKTKQVNGLTLHYLPWALVTPCWAIRDGNLYVGFFPQTVLGAADFIASHGPSILDNEQFQAMRQRLAVGGGGPTSIAFTDLPKMLPQTYGPWVALSRAIGFTDAFGLDSPLMIVPPFKTLLDNLSPAGRAAWTDDAGFHARAISPFPGSAAFGLDLTSSSGAQTPLLVAILLPSLSKARETANRAKDAVNLRMIAQGCQLYANENQYRMPPDLGTISLKEDLVPGTFLSPLSNTTLPTQLGSPAEQVQWINQHSDYVYLGAGKTVASMTADKVLAYDNLRMARAHGGMNIVFGDGHVDWLNYADGEKIVRAAK